ncbi:MAG: hypothetical protein QM784_08790 [Polyangiaceae bacterium]
MHQVGYVIYHVEKTILFSNTAIERYSRSAVSFTLLVLGFTTHGCDGILDMSSSESGADRAGSPASDSAGGRTANESAEGGHSAASTTLAGVSGSANTGGSNATDGSGGSGGSGGISTGSSAASSTGASAFGGQTNAQTTSGGGSSVPSGRKGMTWGKLARFYLSKLEWLGCNGEPLVDGKNHCDARAGDTECGEARPILCLEDVHSPRPGYTVPGSPGGTMVDEYYAGWAGGRVATTGAVIGTTLTSRARGDEVCRTTLGGSWRMAEFHDGWWIVGMSATQYLNGTWDYARATGGGWSFFATVDSPMPESTRYWVAIDDQQANCWDQP